MGSKKKTAAKPKAGNAAPKRLEPRKGPVSKKNEQKETCVHFRNAGFNHDGFYPQANCKHRDLSESNFLCPADCRHRK